MGILKDTNAQTSFDFLIGIVIFVVTFMTIVIFVPGMFTPFISESDELTLVADRVSVRLVEGYLIDSPKNPNLLNNTTKINDFFNNKLTSEYDNTIYELGLNRTGSYRSYDINASLYYESANQTKIGGENPPYFGNIGQTVRVVLVNTSTNEVAILSIKVW